MHKDAIIPMPNSILKGGSFALNPESWAKNVKNGTFMPACSNTPAEASCKRTYTSASPPAADAWTTIALVVNPENRGNAEIDAAPTKQKMVVNGMVLYNPPRSVIFAVPVLNST